MLDLKNIKIVVFDFDNTLAIYDDYTFQYIMDNDKLYSILLNEGIGFWKNAKVNRHFYKFVSKLKQMNKEMYLCSGIQLPIESNLKLDWVRKNYNVDMNNACIHISSYPDGKLSIIKSLCEYHKCKPEEVLFIDDCWEIIAKIVNFGCQAMMPINVVDYIETDE